MISDPQALAIMLLTVSFGKSGHSGVKPLTTKEWARFAVWLKDHDLEPSALLKGDLKALLSGWTDRTITVPRLELLLDRGCALGIALEKWQRAGLWFLARSDPEYPERLKRRLRFESPPILFGCGNRKLLDRGGIAVVGSRNAAEDDIAFAGNLGANAAGQGHSIVSGGARGVDESAMLEALKNEGTAVGVLAGGLLRAATSARYRKYLLSDDLVLATPFNPEAGFHVGNAMSRNRYIYCLADAAVVVSSTRDSGGTWNGAIEDLNAAWIPLWVKHPASTKSGNSELVRRGAHWIPDDLASLACLLEAPSAATAKNVPPDLPLKVPEAISPDTPESAKKVVGMPDGSSDTAEAQTKKTKADRHTDETRPDRFNGTFYDLFLIRMQEIAANGPMKVADIAVQMELQKSQVQAWLKQGILDGKIEKLERPARYQPTAGLQSQVHLFDDGG